jgi:hypothetical protein
MANPVAIGGDPVSAKEKAPPARPMLSLTREEMGSQAMIIPGAVFGNIEKIARSGKQLGDRRARADQFESELESSGA